MKNNWGFSFAGRSIDYFGSESITSDITALFELIKNSRDANAKKVTVNFKNLGKEDGQIEVYDNGDGMSENDIKEKWMVIGTDSRIHNDKTKNGKPVWGEKGIGRMACQKLGGMTELVSVKNKQRLKMTFDWSLFEKSGVTVDQITFPVDTGSSGDMKSGLTLKISNLKSKWTSKNINEFKEELSILISDEIFDEIEIVIKVAQGEEETIGKNYAKLRERVTKNAPFKLKAKFTDNKLTVSIFTQVGQKGSWTKQDIIGTYDDASVGPFSVDIFHFPRAPGKEKSSILEKYYDVRISTDKLEAFLKHNYGMYLYRDGAWMKPYGGDLDWLSLEAGARQETSKIGLKQIFGQIILTKKKNPKIMPASHRETLIQNKEFMDLKKIMREIFEILRNYMKKWKKQQQKTTLEDMRPSPTNPDDTVDVLCSKMKKITSSLTGEQKNNAKMTLDAIQTLNQTQKEESERVLSEIGEIRSYEKNLATLGIATSYMARQVAEPLEKNMQIVSKSEDMREKIKERDWKMTEKEIIQSEKMLNDMKNNQNQMLHFMKFVSVLADHISKSISRNKRYTQVNVLECWQTVSDGFQDKKEELRIETLCNPSHPRNKHDIRDLVIKIDRIDLECILTNLYLNSIESLRRITGKRKVECHYWHDGNSLFIEFSDNGRGIPKSKLEEIFEPFKFGHNQDNSEMHGHGLGLYLVKKIMENYDGTATAVDVKEGAKIRVVFPNVTKVGS